MSRRAALCALLLAAGAAVTLMGAGCSGQISQRPAPQGETTFPAPPATTTPPGTVPAGEPKATVESTATSYTVSLDPAQFVRGVSNPYFPLRPGDHWTYLTKTKDGTERNDVVVTKQTRTILGIEAVVVHDIVTVGNQVKEDTYDWYAQDQDGTVWYLGEKTEELERGKVISTEGSWEAGVDGAQPGVIMQAEPQRGSWYWQEYFAGKAEDQARVIALGASARVPAGRFSDLLVTEERSPLEPGVMTRKYYRRGVGVVLERASAGPMETSVLVRHTTD